MYEFVTRNRSSEIFALGKVMLRMRNWRWHLLRFHAIQYIRQVIRIILNRISENLELPVVENMNRGCTMGQNIVSLSQFMSSASIGSSNGLVPFFLAGTEPLT